MCLSPTGRSQTEKHDLSRSRGDVSHRTTLPPHKPSTKTQLGGAVQLGSEASRHLGQPAAALALSQAGGRRRSALAGISPGVRYRYYHNEKGTPFPSHLVPHYFSGSFTQSRNTAHMLEAPPSPSTATTATDLPPRSITNQPGGTR